MKWLFLILILFTFKSIVICQDVVPKYRKSTCDHFGSCTFVNERKYKFPKHYHYFETAMADIYFAWGKYNQVKHRVLYQCNDTIFVHRTRYDLVVTKRTVPKPNEKFYVFSSYFCFMPEGSFLGMRNHREPKYSRDNYRKNCNTPDNPIPYSIQALNFHGFIEDSLLYPYYSHSEIESLILSIQSNIRIPGILLGHKNLKDLEIDDLGGHWKVNFDADTAWLKQLISLKVFIAKVPNGFDFSPLKNIKSLELFDCGIKEFPMGIIEMKDLEVLILNGNPIDKLPDELSQLKKLRLLSLGETKISPEEAHRIADQMPSVRYLFHN